MKNIIQTPRGPKSEETILNALDALELMPDIQKALQTLDQSATHDGLKNCEIIAKVNNVVKKYWK